MRKKAILITGAAGEIGQALIESLSASQPLPIVSMDLQSMPPTHQQSLLHITGDILNQSILSRLVTEYEFDSIYHLAALLSTRSEFSPELAHKVNVDGTLALLELAAEQTQRRGDPVKFIFPSSIAAYGIPDLATKVHEGAVEEWQWNNPTTMYGCNKLYCEQLGVYYARYYQQLANNPPVKVDFRSLRFPGLISAFTVPSGGTTDYGPEMLHAAAQREPYACFVREDSVLPFMVMSDAVNAILTLAEAPIESLGRLIYNVTSFSLSAGDFRELVLEAFPEAEISFVPDLRRQAIVDSWPADLDDRQARAEWGWEPQYGLERAFHEYLVPNIVQRYQG